MAERVAALNTKRYVHISREGSTRVKYLASDVSAKKINGQKVLRFDLVGTDNSTYDTGLYARATRTERRFWRRSTYRVEIGRVETRKEGKKEIKTFVPIDTQEVRARTEAGARWSRRRQLDRNPALLVREHVIFELPKRKKTNASPVEVVRDPVGAAK